VLFVAGYEDRRAGFQRMLAITDEDAAFSREHGVDLGLRVAMGMEGICDAGLELGNPDAEFLAGRSIGSEGSASASPFPPSDPIVRLRIRFRKPEMLWESPLSRSPLRCEPVAQSAGNSETPALTAPGCVRD
jgi:hypothetical protein